MDTQRRLPRQCPTESPRWLIGLKTLDSALAVPLIALVRLYQLVLSPWLGGQCRFHPTCSCYSLDALKTYGAVRGSYLTVSRLLRCQPFHRGGLDPVPSPNKPTR